MDGENRNNNTDNTHKGTQRQRSQKPQSAVQIHNRKVDEAYARFVAQQNNSRIKSDTRTIIAVIIGAAIMAINLKTFINQGNLVPGGANGIVVLAQRLTNKFYGIQIPFTPLSIAINALPAWLAFRTVGKKFTLYSCLCIVLMSFLTDMIPARAITEDPLLIAVFGGLINGAAISLILNAGASSGGSDFVAMYFSVKKGIRTWNYVLLFNACLILISGVQFGMDSALYTIIFQFCQTQVLNTLYKRYTKKCVLVVTDRPEAVSDEIMAITHHGSTIWKAEGAYTHLDHYLIYVVVGADEIQQLRRHVRGVDSHAFINVMNSDSVSGNFYMKPID